MRRILLFVLLTFISGKIKSQCISTFAGGGFGNNDSAKVVGITPLGLTIDKKGNIYIADFIVNVVYKINPSGICNIVAGNGVQGYSGDGGIATKASLNMPYDIAVDDIGNLYISDKNNFRIRKVDTLGIISTFMGNGTKGFSRDSSLVDTSKIFGTSFLNFDKKGNLLFSDSCFLRMVDTAGRIFTIAGNGITGFSGDGGQAISAEINFAWNAFVDRNNTIFFIDGQRIRKIDTSGIITTVAGNGVQGYGGDGGMATLASFNNPYGIVVDTLGRIFISDASNNRIREVDTNGIINNYGGVSIYGSYGGDGGNCSAANLFRPSDMNLDFNENLIFADENNYRVRKINSSGIINTIAGNGTEFLSGDGCIANSAQLRSPHGITFDKTGNFYIADYHNNVVRKIDTLGIISTFAGSTGTSVPLGDNGPAILANLGTPLCVASDRFGNLYVATDYQYRIRKIDTLGIITTLAGNGVSGYSGDGGPATLAAIGAVTSIVIDTAGNMYFSSQNHTVRKLSNTGTLSTVAGNGSAGYTGDNCSADTTRLYLPQSIALDKYGNLLVADYGNRRIRKVDLNTNIISTIAGTGLIGHTGDGGAATSAKIDNPVGLIVDATGNIYFSEPQFANYIRKIDTSGIITTISGNGVQGYGGDGGLAINASLNSPAGMTQDKNGSIYFSDQGNNVIRKITFAAPSSPHNVTQCSNLIVCSGNSAILTVSGSSSIKWYSDSLLTNQIASGNTFSSPPLNVPATFYVIDSSVCGISPIVSIHVSAESCTWPGDANEDFIVDNTDLLPIGIKYGTLGNERCIITNNWQGYPCISWSDTLSNGKNTKYTDCDGSGLIDMNDTIAVNLNYNLTHTVRYTAPQNVYTTNADVYVLYDKTQYSPGDTVNAYVYIGSSTNPQSNFYGAAFTLQYDNNNVVSGTEKFWFNNSWVGVINQTKIKLSKLNAGIGTVDVGLVRVTHTDTNGYGKVATLQFVLSNTITATVFHTTISSAIKTNGAGTYGNLIGGTDTVIVVQNVNYISQVSGINSHISVFPNPTSSTLQVGGIKQYDEIQMFDVFGNKVVQQINLSSNQQITININSLSPGVYTLALKGQYFKVVKE